MPKIPHVCQNQEHEIATFNNENTYKVGWLPHCLNILVITCIWRKEILKVIAISSELVWNSAVVDQYI